MNKKELEQRMMLCVATLYNLSGSMPQADELYSALGSEYSEVLNEYLSGKNVLTAAA